MPQDLLSPDEFGQMLADPAFSALPFDTRKSYVEKGIGEASRFIAERGGGWTPETWQKFGSAAQTARQFVNDSETLTETGKRYAGVAGQTIKDLTAIFGVGAVGLSPVLPDGKPGAGVVGQIPGETLGPALGRNIVSLAASGAAMLSNAEKPLVQKLDKLKQQIDAGDFLTHKGGFQGWIDQQHQAVKDEQAKFYENKDWADQNSLLGNPENAQLMQNYLVTRSPESWAALQSNVLRTPFMAKLQGDKTALETQSKLGQALKPETQNLISEAADPAEIVPGFFAAKKGMEAMQTGMTLGKRAKDAAKGVLGEMAGEQVSASIDNPYVTAEQRLQVAKDSLAGALGLMGAGAGVQAVANRLSPQDPNAPLPPTQTATPSPTAPNASAAAQVGATPAETVSTLSRIAAESVAPEEDTGAFSAQDLETRRLGDLESSNQAGVGQKMSDVSGSPSLTVSPSPSLSSTLTPGERAPADMTAPDAIAGVNAAPAQTITGFNAQMGAEMPVPSPTAEAGAGTGAMVRSPEAQAYAQAVEDARLAEAARLRMIDNKAQGMPVIPDSPTGSRDILDFANENPIYLPPGFSEQRNLPEYENLKEAKLPQYWRQFIASGKRGGNPSTVAQRAFDAGLIPEPTADAYFTALREGIDGRKQYRAQFATREKALAAEEKQVVAFDKAQTKLAKKTDTQEVPFEDVLPGDKMTIDGEEAVVKNVEHNEDGYLTNVVIEDGKRFGLMNFDPQNRSGILVDEYQPQAARNQIAASDFAPADTAPASLDSLLTGTESTRPLNVGETARSQNADPLGELMGAKMAGEAEQAQGKMAPLLNPAQASASRARPVEKIAFEKPIETPAGKIVSYEWQYKLEEVPDKEGEMGLQRFSDWEKAESNAETGRDIVHQFTLQRPDGSLQLVSLESALGKIPAAAAKDFKAVIKAARRLPVYTSELARLESQQQARIAAEQKAQKEDWKNAPAIELRSSGFPVAMQEGNRMAWLDGREIAFVDKRDITPSGDRINSAIASQKIKTEWALQQIRTPALSYKEQERIENLRRSIKRDKATLDAASAMRASDAAPLMLPKNFTGNAQAGLAKAAAQNQSLPQRGRGAEGQRNLLAAYQSAARGSSTQMLPIRAVYEQARAQNPALTPAQFMAEVQAGDAAGTVLLEPFDSPQGVKDAGEFVARNASGVPSTRMMVAAPAGGMTNDGMANAESLASPAELKAAQKANESKLKALGLPTKPGTRIWARGAVATALKKISQDDTYPATMRAMADLLAKVDLNNLLLKIEGDARLSYAGKYQPLNAGRGEISLNTRVTGRGDTDIVQSLVHELLHHATFRALRSPKNATQKGDIADLEALRKRALAALSAQEIGRQFDYELSNTDEFIAALFTRADFQTALAGIPHEAAPKSLSQRVRSVLDEIFRVLGELVTGKTVPPGSVLEASFSATLRLMESGEVNVQARLGNAIMTHGPGPVTILQRALRAVKAYHGTPHKVDKFTTGKIGTGEGAQAYGWGLYFAQGKAVAEQYRQQLGGGEYVPNETRRQYYTPGNIVKGYSGFDRVLDYQESATGWTVKVQGVQRGPDGEWVNRNERPRVHATSPNLQEVKKLGLPTEFGGNLYTVELIPDEDTFLEWDKPLSAQSEKVKAALRPIIDELVSPAEQAEFERMGGRLHKASTTPLRWDGKTLYRQIAENPSAASERLAALGIPGIRYFDGQSRRPGIVTEQLRSKVADWRERYNRNPDNFHRQELERLEAELASFEAKDITRNFVVFDEKHIRITEENGQPVPGWDHGPEMPALLNPALNPFTSSDAPGWVRTLFKVPSVGEFRVRNLSVRQLLTGSALPKAMAEIVTASTRDKQSIEYAAATLANDLERAMQAHSKATGQSEQAVNDLVTEVLQGNVPASVILNPDLKTAIRRARYLLDSLSVAVGTATGGGLGQTIMQNLGQWMRRSFAAFDPDAGWSFDALTDAAKKGKKVAGMPAAKILSDARRYLRAQPGAAGMTNGELEAQMRKLMDRNLWEEVLTGTGAGVSKDVTSLMKRKDIAPEILALMGEERNPVKKLLGSAKWQAQFVAKHDNQVKLRDLGLQLGMMSPTQEGRFTEALGEDRRSSGFALNGKSVYTSPELRAALGKSVGVIPTEDLGGTLLKTIYWLGGQAKLNKVALNPDSWLVNLLGNVSGLVMTGGASPFAPMRLFQNSRKAIELMRAGNPIAAAGTAAQTQRDLMRAMMVKLTAAGVADSSMNAALVEDALNKNLIQFIQKHDVWNGAVGAVKLAVIGQAMVKPLGVTARLVAGAASAAGGYLVGNERVQNVQEAIAKWTMQNPDRFGKIVEFLDNHTTLLAAGLTPEQAFAKATTKTLNTMPDYSKLPPVLRQFSRLGVVGSFIAFQWEVYRNSFHNAKYIVEELGSGNPALMEKGARRLLGMGTVYALTLGGLQAILGNSAGDDDKDEAYRRALGKPWEKYSRLAYTRLDTEKASFYNTSYLLPQVTLTEIVRAAAEGKTFAQAMEMAGGVLQKQFAETGIHADPLIALLFNIDKGGQKATTEEGWRATAERLGEVLAPMTPGAADKFERILRAGLNQPRWDREFSIEEEMKRLLGMRQATYSHDRRIAGRLAEFNSRKRDIGQTAAQTYGETGKGKADVWGKQQQQQAAQRATERLTALKAEYDQFVQDLGTLGFKPTQIERFRKDAGTSPNWKPYGITPEGIKQP